jgi:DNA-binding MarR family transcriptional regulator
MNTNNTLQIQVMMAARDQGISSVLFRNATARALGLNMTDSECLSFLTIQGGTATPTEISRYTNLTSGATTSMLDRLEKAGFIRRTPNPNDRRGTLIELCDKWKEVSMPLVMGIQKSHRELIASYSDAELEIITDFLKRFTHNVNEAARAIEQDIV